MGTAVAIGKGIVTEMVVRAGLSSDEVCGLLLGTSEHVEAVVHCANVAADAATTFEIDPAKLIAAHRRARAGELAVIGCYHSHPSGIAGPSARDATDAAPDNSLWVIIADGKLTAWRAVTDGLFHGRFVPVDVDSS